MPDPRAARIAALLAEAERFETRAEAAFLARDTAAAVEAYEQAIERRVAAEALGGPTVEEQVRAADAPGLPAGKRARTIRSNMNVDNRGQPAAVKRAAGRSTRKHPAQKRLYQRGVTISALALALHETRARVSSWFAAGDGNRPIPRHHAEALRDRYGIPLGDWSRIAD